MNPEHEPQPPADVSPRFDDSAVCDECGRYGALRIGERKLCPDCYETSGSCCPEFGKDDRWEFGDQS
jgi:hypothetical protein